MAYNDSGFQATSPCPQPGTWTGTAIHRRRRQPVLPPRTQEHKILRYRLLACDQRSFLTGSRRVDMQAAHIINTVREDDRRKANVEELLTQQRLHHSSFQTFDLDSIINGILLEATYHVQWDVYGTFCIVPAVDDARAMLSALRTSNQQWTVNEFNDRPARPLDVGVAPFDRPKWDVVILHPRGLLPDGETLPIAQGRYFETQTSSPPQNAQVTWTYWTASSDQLVSPSDPNDFFPPFTAQDARSMTHNRPSPPISSLAMVVNANAKLQSFMKDHRASATPRITMFANLVSELMDEIFFVPRGFRSRLDDYDSLSLQAPAQPHPIEAVSGTGNPAPTGHQFGQPSTSVGSMELEPDAPEQPDDDDGLTPLEFRLLAQRARDPELRPRDRSNAASMLIFGVHGFTKPYA
ncbi:unnamed protein product [Cyclocybe aegerita]|uniref:HNH nuclease domain-containing protein n=1 Tax=Cyclocybe aegerita TaxID=1973307 RepID=A0A8S0X7D5_CYCAE|nr:unnamed protein product [Cyclocybe aegerita]